MRHDQDSSARTSCLAPKDCVELKIDVSSDPEAAEEPFWYSQELKTPTAVSKDKKLIAVVLSVSGILMVRQFTSKRKIIGKFFVEQSWLSKGRIQSAYNVASLEFVDDTYVLRVVYSSGKWGEADLTEAALLLPVMTS